VENNSAGSSKAKRKRKPSASRLNCPYLGREIGNGAKLLKADVRFAANSVMDVSTARIVGGNSKQTA
jgi:hypothetical protein